MRVETIIWISVNQAVPPSRVTVLIHLPKSNREKVTTGYRYRNGWRTHYGFPLLQGAVTDWADLPKPPHQTP